MGQAVRRQKTRRHPFKVWSPREDDILQAEYAGGTTYERMMELLPGRSAVAIRYRASQRKIPRGGAQPFRRPFRAVEEKQIADYIAANGVRRFEPGTMQHFVENELIERGHEIGRSPGVGWYLLDGERTRYKTLIAMADQYRTARGAESIQMPGTV